MILRSLLFFCWILSFATNYSQNTGTIYLSDIKQEFIANEFGPPMTDMSFGKHPIKLKGKTYTKGICMHAPAEVYIHVNKKAHRLMATVGIDDEVNHSRQAIQTSINDLFWEKSNHYKWFEQDDFEKSPDAATEHTSFSPKYVYDANVDVLNFTQGATVCFKVFGDGKEIFNSGWMNEYSEPQNIDIDVSKYTVLQLKVEKGNDGSFLDHADWADAKLVTQRYSGTESFFITSVNKEILLNHSGFLPKGIKQVRWMTPIENDSFQVISMETHKPVFRGSWKYQNGDWGEIYVGDFSPLTTAGTYYIKSGDQKSHPFSIDQQLYTQNLKKHLNWFLWQRCGDPNNGFSRGCHLDDGIRKDNKEHQDVTGGWHDAADHRKWSMTIAGYFALGEVALQLKNTKYFEGKDALKKQIADELLWGRKYYLKMQEPDGYIMKHIGGDVLKHSDSDRYTDNISDNEDDRILVTDPANANAQAIFIISQCNLILGNISAQKEADLEAAVRCYNWLTQNQQKPSTDNISSLFVATIKLFEVTKEDKYYLSSKELFNKITELLQSKKKEPYGYFLEAGKVKNPKENIWCNLSTPNFPSWALAEALRFFTESEMKKQARSAFNKYFEGYIQYFDEKSTYGIVPMAMYKNDPGGNRIAGKNYYRWCYINNENTKGWNGINSHIGFVGAALVRGGIITNNTEAIKIGQQQLDFIYGCNPFNASTVTTIGYNQPNYFKSHTHVPFTPEIPGAVMAGIGSTKNDLPALYPGWWQTTEYWMQAVAGTIVLLNELNYWQNMKE